MHTPPDSPVQSGPTSTAWTIIKWLLLIAVLAGAIAAVQHYRQPASEAPQKDGKKFDAANKPAPVAVAKAETYDLNVYLDALGTVTPRNSVVVKARVDGQLLSLHFREGQMVKAGELLAEIDPRPFEVQLAQANAQLSKDKALLENAQIDLERYKTLLAQDSISRQQTDTQASLVRQYQAALALDQAQIDTARLQLTYCRITAPINGRVGLRQVDPGNMIHSSDANGIVTITQMQPITVLFNIPEDNLPAVNRRMKAGETLPVEAYDRGQKTKLASGTLLTPDNQIDTTTGTIKLRAEFKNEDGALFPNQFVNTRMLLDVVKAATVVPVAALQRGSKGDYVYLLRGDGTVTLRPVKTGQVDGERVAITEGLAVGDSVVTDGADKLRNGAKVQVGGTGKSESPDGADKSAGHRPYKEGARRSRNAE